jgi:hypothetical protein
LAVASNLQKSPIFSSGGRCFTGEQESGAGVGWQWNLVVLVVEHKAQTHNGGFALVSRFVRAVYSAAPMYL